MINLRHIQLIAAVAFAFVVGCGRDAGEAEKAAAEPTPAAVEPAPAAELTEPKTAMELLKDPDFRPKLDASAAERRRLLSIRARITERMETLIAEAKSRLGTEDEAVLKVELEKNPEWNSLYRRCEDVNQALHEQRRKITGELSRRMNPRRNEKTSEKISK